MENNLINAEESVMDLRQFWNSKFEEDKLDMLFNDTGLYGIGAEVEDLGYVATGMYDVETFIVAVSAIGLAWETLGGDIETEKQFIRTVDLFLTTSEDAIKAEGV